MSDVKPILAGVPQGSVLGPLLYLIFTSDIPLPVQSSILGKFADNTTYLSSHKEQEVATEAIEENLRNATTWKDKKYIKLNCDKTVYMIFSNRTIKN